MAARDIGALYRLLKRLGVTQRQIARLTVSIAARRERLIPLAVALSDRWVTLSEMAAGAMVKMGP